MFMLSVYVKDIQGSCKVFLRSFNELMKRCMREERYLTECWIHLQRGHIYLLSLRNSRGRVKVYVKVGFKEKGQVKNQQTRYQVYFKNSWKNSDKGDFRLSLHTTDDELKGQKTTLLSNKEHICFLLYHLTFNAFFNTVLSLHSFHSLFKVEITMTDSP